MCGLELTLLAVTHSPMGTETPGFDVLVDGPVDLAELLSYQPDAIVSRTLLDADSTTVTLFALDEGQRISEHSAPHDAIVQIVDGHGAVTIDGDRHELQAGQALGMPANEPHAVDAPSPFKMLLTMVR